MNTLSFPGLGIGEFQVNKVAFTVFGQSVMWYGIIITFGIVLAFFYVLYRAKFEKIKVDDILDLGIFIIIFGMLGARIYYVIMRWDTYSVTGGYFWDNLWDTLVNIMSFRKGGLAIYGALIAGFLTILAVAKVKKIKYQKFLDMVAPAAMLGQIIGRWGNFVNVEAYGSQTDLPWRMGILTSSGSTMYVHPTFLYESLWNLAGFIIINIVYKKKKYDGQIFLMYMTWYGFGRMFIEALRTDSLMVGVFRVSQLVGFVTFAVGTILLIVFGIRARNEKIARGAYENLFLKEEEKPNIAEESEENEEIRPILLSDDGVLQTKPSEPSSSEDNKNINEGEDGTDGETH